MKRRRNMDPDNVKAESCAPTTTTAAAEIKKKGKKKIEQERKIDNEESSVRMVERYISCGELPWLRGVVDEQMSWSSIWLPFWDVEYMGDACSEMFSDVVWDYDIWNLRNIDEVPNP